MSGKQTDEEVPEAASLSRNVSMNLQEKQGAKCCGCCCDYRRAVVVVAILWLILSIATLIGAFFPLPAVAIGYDDDEVQEFVAEASLTHDAILSGVTIVASIAALLGAKMYNIYLIALNILWIITNLIAAIILELQVIDDTNAEFEGSKEGYETYGAPIPVFVIQGIVAILLIYPHAGFIKEVKQGILSPETYPREEFSCCCTDRRR